MIARYWNIAGFHLFACTVTYQKTETTVFAPKNAPLKALRSRLFKEGSFMKIGVWANIHGPGLIGAFF